MNLSTTNRLDKPKNGKLYAAALLVVIIVLVGGFFALNKLQGGKSPIVSGLTNNPLSALKTGTYWAVFLTNGQTYFGRLDPDDLNGNYLNLSEVYYLEKTTAQAPAAGKATESTTPGYNLIHLGNELHGPTDAMVINRQSVLFIEQLKPDSKVVTTIQSAKR